MTRFIDYFFMCGLSDSKEPKLYKVHEDGSASGFREKRLVSSVLCHFPKNVADNPWNSAELWKLCTPCGLSVFVGSTTPTTVPHFHSFLITREDASKCYGHVLSFYERCTNSLQSEMLADLLQFDELNQDDSIYIEKCIGFLTQLPLINTCERVLKTLFKMFMDQSTPTNNNGLPIESYIYNLLYEVPQLSPGSSVKLSCMGHEDPTILHQPTINELPLLDVYLTQVMGLVGGAKNFLILLTSVLLEHQILLVSEDSHRLALVGEGITALLFPFQWQHTHISVLPYDLASHFFDAPVTYLIGVLVLPGQKEMIRQTLEVNQCYADLDEAIVECPEDQPAFPNYRKLNLQFDSFRDTYLREMKSISKRTFSTSSENEKFYPSKPNKATLDPKPNSSLHSNETIKKVADIARKAGVIDSLDDIETLHANPAAGGKLGVKLQISERTLCEHKFNISVRESICSVFLSIFLQYDKFVIAPSLDEHGTWIQSADTYDNFDKTSFLSDQPESRLPFLLSFLDSQMFTTFIDYSLMFHQGEMFTKDPNMRLFDDRIDQSKVPFEARSPTTPDLPPAMKNAFRTISVSSNNIGTTYYEAWRKEAESLVQKRFSKVDVMTGLPQPISKLAEKCDNSDSTETPKGTFPRIRAKLLESKSNEKTKKLLRRQHGSNRTSLRRQHSSAESKWKKIPALLRQPSMSEYSPEIIAQTNWMFVKKLLKDIKQKTNKILVGKMGKEAVELGHGELCDSLSNLEESTWIASLCDLLERVWSHGLLTTYKKGKSALWSHLLQYQVEEEENNRRKNMMPHFGGSSPSLLDNVKVDGAPSNEAFDPTSSYNSLPRSFGRKRTTDSPKRRIGSEARQSSTESNNGGPNSVAQVSFSLPQSIERIQSMREIQTEVGRSRAWIRLALEQKQLNPYMKKLLCNHRLLDYMYKKYSLLQCEDEREQFLFHVLSLAAADFTCFTNSFTKTVIDYKVWIVPGKQYQFAQSSQTSANVHMSINGELGKTEKICLPKGCNQFSFKHRNLGIITTLIIGHDNAGILPKWLVDYVLVQNQVTGQTLCFPCRRFLGKGVDDNSTERLLVAECVPRSEDIIKFSNRLLLQNAKSSTLNIPELQEKVGQAVNSLIKYYHKSERERRLDVSPPPAAFTKLLYNLVVALETVFNHGLKPVGILKRRRLFALEIISICFESFRQSSLASMMIFHEPAAEELEPPEPTHVAAGGDWFLGSRRTSAINAAAQQRSRDMVFDSRDDENDSAQSEALLEKERRAFARMCQLYQQITSAPRQHLGKDDIFRLLMVIGIHEQSIALWLPRICEIAQNTNNLYEDHAFLLNETAVTFMSQIITLLVENEVPLDSSLLRGFDNLVNS